MEIRRTSICSWMWLANCVNAFSSSQEVNLLCAVLHLKFSRHTSARSRLASTRRLDTVHLLDAPRGALLRSQLEPGDGLGAILARGRIGRGAGSGIFGSWDLAQVAIGRVQVEEGLCRREEVVVPADGVVAGGEALVGRGRDEVVGVGARLGGGEVEGEGDAREHVE